MPWQASGNSSLLGLGFRFGFGATCGGMTAAGIVAIASNLLHLVF